MYQKTFPLVRFVRGTFQSQDRFFLALCAPFSFAFRACLGGNSGHTSAGAHGEPLHRIDISGPERRNGP